MSEEHVPQTSINRLQRLRYLLDSFEPMLTPPRMETPVRPLVNPPAFDEMWATVQRRKR